MASFKGEIWPSKQRKSISFPVLQGLIITSYYWEIPTSTALPEGKIITVNLDRVCLNNQSQPITALTSLNLCQNNRLPQNNHLCFIFAQKMCSRLFILYYRHDFKQSQMYYDKVHKLMSTYQLFDMHSHIHLQ